MAIAVACNLELSSFGASVGGYLLEKSWLRRLPVLAQWNPAANAWMPQYAVDRDSLSRSVRGGAGRRSTTHM